MFKNLWFQFLKALAMLAGAVLAADILLITAEVLFRNLGWRGLGWASDVIEYSLPLSTLLVAPWLVAQKGHVKLDLLVERMASPHRDLLFRATMWLATGVTGAPTLNAEQMVFEDASPAAVSNSLTAGRFRNPLPISTGQLLASYTTSPMVRTDTQFRLYQLRTDASNMLVANTHNGARQLGVMWRNMVYSSELPITREASMNSSSRSDNTLPRTTRTTDGV